jgi:hypothetical protein
VGPLRARWSVERRVRSSARRLNVGMAIIGGAATAITNIPLASTPSSVRAIVIDPIASVRTARQLIR